MFHMGQFTVFTCHDSSSLDVSATSVIGDPLANLSEFGEVKFKYLGLEVFNVSEKRKIGSPNTQSS